MATAARRPARRRATKLRPRRGTGFLKGPQGQTYLYRNRLPLTDGHWYRLPLLKGFLRYRWRPNSLGGDKALNTNPSPTRFF